MIIKVHRSALITGKVRSTLTKGHLLRLQSRDKVVQEHLHMKQPLLA